MTSDVYKIIFNRLNAGKRDFFVFIAYHILVNGVFIDIGGIA